jgi:hypothetical protein
MELIAHLMAILMPLLWYLCDELNLTGTLIVQDP